MNRLVGSLSLLCGICLNADSLDFWNLRYAETNLGSFHGVFAEGKFVVGGSSIRASSDGRVWRQVLADRGGYVVFGNGAFVASGTDGKIHVSNNGENWITRRSPIAGGISSLAFGLGSFLLQAGDSSHTLLCSTNGLEWRVCSTNGPYQNFVFCYDRFLTTGPEPIQSFDGTNFVIANGWPAFSSVAYLNGTWVTTDISTGGNPPLKTLSLSTNGVDWVTFLPTPYASEENVVSVAGNIFVLTIGREFFFVSDDGLNWVDHQVAIGPKYRVNKVLFGADSLLALCRFSQDTPKPGVSISVDQFYQSRPLTPGTPTLLSASLLPALSLFDGIPGSGYAIESADSPAGPWRRVTNIFPSTFPYVFLAPDGDQPGKLYRALSE